MFIGNGAGGFGTQTNYGVSGSVIAIDLADINQDNKLDIIAASTSSEVYVLLGTGTGGFGAVTTYPDPGAASSLFVRDYNGDGKPDIAVGLASGGTKVLQNTATVHSEHLSTSILTAETLLQ